MLSDSCLEFMRSSLPLILRMAPFGEEVSLSCHHDISNPDTWLHFKSNCSVFVKRRQCYSKFLKALACYTSKGKKCATNKPEEYFSGSVAEAC